MTIPANYAQACRCKVFASDLAVVAGSIESARWNACEVDEADEALRLIERARSLLEDASARLSPGVSAAIARADFQRCESERA